MSSFDAQLQLTGDKPETLTLTFTNAQKADQWWGIIQNTDWKTLPLKKDNVKRPSPTSFTFPSSKDGADALMKAIQSNDAMKPVKDDVKWKASAGADESGKGEPTDTAALQKRITELEAKLKEAERNSVTTPSSALAVIDPVDLPLESTTGGKNWRGGARFQGGPQHYQMATDAFKMSLECKDRGDNRDFQMIFSQIFMEQRRTVGVRGKSSDERYNSSKLISEIYAKAKELQDRGDDRPFGLIFGSLSMAFRRGTVLW